MEERRLHGSIKYFIEIDREKKNEVRVTVITAVGMEKSLCLHAACHKLSYV